MIMKEGLAPGEALFSWNNPLTGWDESFESGELPEEWSQIVTNTGSNAGLPATWTITGPINLYNTTINPQDGDYQVFMMWDFMMWDFSEQDEWLITREFTVPAGRSLECQQPAFRSKRLSGARIHQSGYVCRTKCTHCMAQ